MNERRSVKAPNSFWIVAGLSMAWNALGAVDYVMTRMRNTEYLKNAGDPEVLLHWIDGYPLWAQIAWPVGCDGSGSSATKRPSSTTATAPQRETHRAQ